MPTTTPQERARKATAERVRHARNRRFRRYAVEMTQAPIPDDVIVILAQELYLRGWTVIAPDRKAV